MSRKQIQMRPGKGPSGMGFIGGIVFCLIGLFIVVPTFGAFGLLWTLIAAGITGVHGYNLFSEKGINTYEMTIEDDGEPDAYRMSGYPDDRSPSGADRTAEGQTAQERILEAKKLLDSGLITAEEYEEKRKQILEEL